MNQARLREILEAIRESRVLVIGDLFLDKYLLIDAALSETSLETGLEAHQVVLKRLLPGAAGTVAKDLSLLGSKPSIMTIIGSDGEGHEVVEELAKLGISCEYVFTDSSRTTPTYVKPLLKEKDRVRELNRLDMKNRSRTPLELEERICASLSDAVQEADGIAICDQVVEEDCGVLTGRVRSLLETLAARHPDKVFMADSRRRIKEFRGVICKPNHYELAAAVGESEAANSNLATIRRQCKKLKAMTGEPVFATAGAQGIVILPSGEEIIEVPAIPVQPPIDIVGAGDSVLSALVAALSVGIEVLEAAQFAMIVASLIVEQVGTTGSPTPPRVIRHFQRIDHTMSRPAASEA